MDYLSLKAAVFEASSKLTGSRISDAWQASETDVVLVPHRGQALVFSIDARRPGLFLMKSNDPAQRVHSPFTELLRARIRGNAIGSIRIPISGERIVVFTFTSVWPSKAGSGLDMALEVMGRRSNLMILEGDRVLQPLRTVPKEKSRVRPVVAGEPYVFPPPQAGVAIEDVTGSNAPIIESSEDTHRLIENIRGMSPPTALQAAKVAFLDAPETATEGIRTSLAAVVAKMVASCNGEEGFVLHSEGKVHLFPFEPIPVHGSDTVERLTPFSEAALLWRDTQPSDIARAEDETAHIERMLRDRLQRINSAMEQLDAEEERCNGHEKLRVMAEALLINAGHIEAGSTSAVLPDPYEPALELTIPLDRTKSPQENANSLFNRARRLKRGLEEVTDRRTSLKRERGEVRGALVSLLEEMNPGPARSILRDGQSKPSLKKGTSRSSYSGPGRRQTVDGFTILVGKTSTDNENVTFRAAGPNDLWLHARDYPGSHVIILTEKRHVPDKVLYKAAALAAEGSGARNDSAPEIMVTERKWVRKLKGGKPGQVTVERFRTIRPRSHNQKK